jgi:hypothetical protein
MNAGGREPGHWRPWAPWLALLLWVISLVLGLQCIRSLLEIYYLIFGAFGSIVAAEQFATIIACGAGLLVMIVVMGTAEFHRTRIDQPISWRLFAWTLGGELAVLLVHYTLLHI